jgi:hypothetical protein
MIPLRETRLRSPAAGFLVKVIGTLEVLNVIVKRPDLPKRHA